MREHRFRWVVAAVVIAAAMCGCSSAKTAAPPPACRPAHPPQYPSTSAALADADSGGTYCVVVGQTLTVTVHVPPGDTGPPWQPLTASDTSVLATVGHGAATIPPRATATFFSVRKPGVVTIVGRRGITSLFKVVIVARAK